MDKKIMQKIKNVIELAEKDEKIMAVFLFGSAARGEQYRDIDLCLVLDKKYSNLEMSKKRLEYLSIAKDKVDIQIFQQLPVYIRIRVIKEGKILLCKNEDNLYELAFENIKEFGFYEKLYNLYLERVENG
ncbi:nucleotidyltransferase domain-containing protein [Candidatus Pacearchaeota archaeon]|nr:nucleotidyltransferase domain-containing protein [Candidatus Pacearchaeota archaeon]